MLTLENWEQSAVFDPTDPTQKKIVSYTGIPGGYSSFYFNRVPATGSLDGGIIRGGLRGPFSSGISTGAGITLGLLIGSLAIGGGTWALRKAGVLKKRPGVSGLFGARRRRRC